MKKKYKIFILGAGGQIGKDLVEYFSANYSVYAFLKKNNKKFVKKKNVKYIYHNFINPLNIKIKPDLILNCIVTHEFSRNNSLNNFIKNNLSTIKNIINFVKETNANLINFSSVSVYGKSDQSTLYENSSSSNLDLLGVCKLFVEKAIERENINFINLRLPGVLCVNKEQNRPWLKNIIFNLYNNKNVKIYNYSNKFNNLITSKEIFEFINYLIIKKIFISGNYNFSANQPVKLISLINIIKIFFKSESKIYNIINKDKSFIINTNKFEKTFKFKISKTEYLLKNYLKAIKNI